MEDKVDKVGKQDVPTAHVEPADAMTPVEEILFTILSDGKIHSLAQVRREVTQALGKEFPWWRVHQAKRRMGAESVYSSNPAGPGSLVRGWRLPQDPPEEVDRVRRNVEAKRFLQRVLADGLVSLGRLRELAAEKNLAWRVVERAKANLGVESVKEGFPARVVGWQLPEGGE